MLWCAVTGGATMLRMFLLPFDGYAGLLLRTVTELDLTRRGMTLQERSEAVAGGWTRLGYVAASSLRTSIIF